MVMALFFGRHAQAQVWDQRCSLSGGALPERVSACTTMINSGALHGRELSRA
jgi:hypothetical protein